MPVVNLIEGNRVNITIVPYPSPVVQVIGIQGPKGAKGDITFISAFMTRPAGEVISGHRVVIIRNDRVYYADHTNTETAFYVAGVSVNAAQVGDEVGIVLSGEVELSSWNWEVGKFLYVGANGHLTQTAPSTGYVLAVAKALTPTRIFVSLQSPIILS